ncbi:hypothetical protein BDC45DRAFT_516557 [Circinella umbellata]|nr:hypothetical protein BDC45DRAFT_516557 [Circinella umbellata]
MTNGQRHTEKLDLEAIKKMLPPFPENNNDHYWSLVLLFQPQGSTNKKVISIETAKAQKQDSTDYERIAKELYELSHFMPIKKTNLLWTTDRRNVMPCFYFDSLTEPLEDSAQYALLAGIPFCTSTSECIIYYPVVKKEGDYYKAIGMCRVEERNMRRDFLDDVALQEQTFKIH